MLKLIFLYRELSDQLQIYALLSGRYVSKIGVTIFFFGDYKNNTGSYYAVDRGHPGPLYVYFTSWPPKRRGQFHPQLVWIIRRLFLSLQEVDNLKYFSTAN